jgi:phosphotriesterase-related protein
MSDSGTQAAGGHVMTVLGPVASDQLGITLPHEHVLLDLTCIRQEPVQPGQRALVTASLTLENRGDLFTDPYVSLPNLRLDEPEVAAAEIRRFAAAGGGTLVDLTVQGISPQPVSLREISRQTGVHIVMGCGYYVRRAHPPEVASLSVETLGERLIQEIERGFDGTGIQPGIIGELGTSAPIHPDEEKVLRAGAMAQQATGLAINVHVAIFGRQALAALDVLERAGADISRVVISHLDEMPDTEYHRSVLQRGAYVEFDTFGSEFYFDSDGRREPSDAERVDCLLRLLDEGWTNRLLLSQDVCTKLHLRRYGGFGYAHLLRTIVPRLERRGVDQATIHTLLVENPARLLTVE